MFIKEGNMKNIVLTIFFLNICTFVYAIDFHLSHYTGIRITDNKLYYYAFDNEADNEEYNISWEKINKIEYITFNYTGKFLDEYSQWAYKKPTAKGIKRYLVLYGNINIENRADFFFLYDENNELAFSQWSRDSANTVNHASIAISATSEYRERNIIYSANNLLNYKNLQSWVEAAKGSGIGEKLFLEYNTKTGGVDPSVIPKWKIDGIAISNGFVDYKRPFLYEYNNRIKKIRIHFNAFGDFLDINLEDIPQIQFFDFSGRKSEKIQIEILEVYNGSRYDDTCINLIFPYTWSFLYN